jgi:putative CocE/NonD family hydrolase
LELFPAYLDFFDRVLKGKTDVDQPRIRYFHMGPNKWCDTDVWPLPEATTRRWYLNSEGHANTAAGDGTLDADAPHEEKSDEYRYDPADPVRTYGGKILYNAAGPLNQQHLEQRDDVLCYTSEPATEAFDIMGPVALHLYAASSAIDTDFMTKLTDVFPDGRSIVLLEGARRARYRHGFDKEVFLEPGAIEEYELDLGDTAWRVEPNHRLRVQVESSNFPWLDRNMNTGNAVGDDDAGVVADQTIYHGGEHASYLEAYCL